MIRLHRVLESTINVLLENTLEALQSLKDYHEGQRVPTSTFMPVLTKKDPSYMSIIGDINRSGKTSKVTMIDPKRCIGTQDVVLVDHLRRHLQDPKFQTSAGWNNQDSDDPIDVLQRSRMIGNNLTKVYYVLNGHHRVISALLVGIPLIPAHVVVPKRR